MSTNNDNDNDNDETTTTAAETNEINETNENITAKATTATGKKWYWPSLSLTPWRRTTTTTTTTPTPSTPLSPSPDTTTPTTPDKNDPLREQNRFKTKTKNEERTKDEKPNEYSSVRVGSSIMLLTPEQMEEYLRKKEQEEERQRELKEREEEEQKNIFLRAWGIITTFNTTLIIWLGKVLRRIQTLDMHGGTTGDNTKFVHGLIDFLGGSLGGAAQVYVSQPLDTVKVKQQAFPELYTNMVDCFMQTYRKDGIVRGLYAGSVPAVIANVAENSVLFAAYGGCQKFVCFLVGKRNPDDLTTLQNAFAGSFAAFFSTFSLCPTELIKCKLQALREMHNFVEPGLAKIRTPWSLTRYIYQTEGISGFYRGLGSTFVREMPGYFFFFGGYEGTRELLRHPNETKEQIGPLKTMCAGAVGGITLWVTIFPADVIKSRIQVKNLRASMFTMGLNIIRTEGIRALYNGLLPSIIRTIPATATLFVVYEYTKKALLNTL